ncbi:hypothetical protein F5Y16DRAFT_400447 [Xylariaceae sp. FL0255]|nr:hypothetical protein F5Y16DRAFT_400447 [Xylariaceae sp. FL0255]
MAVALVSHALDLNLDQPVYALPSDPKEVASGYDKSNACLSLLDLIRILRDSEIHDEDGHRCGDNAPKPGSSTQLSAEQPKEVDTKLGLRDREYQLHPGPLDSIRDKPRDSTNHQPSNDKSETITGSQDNITAGDHSERQEASTWTGKHISAIIGRETCRTPGKHTFSSSKSAIIGREACSTPDDMDINQPNSSRFPHDNKWL